MKNVLLFILAVTVAGWGGAALAQGDNAVKAAREAYGLLNTDPAAAAARAREARRLLDANASPGLRADIDVLVAIADFREEPGGGRADALHSTLTDRDENGIKDSSLSAQGWLVLAGYALSERHWDDLVDYGARAEKAIAVVEPNNLDVRAVAIGYQGIGTLHGSMAKRQTLLRQTRPSRLDSAAKEDPSGPMEAIETFERGIALFPRQKDMASFDKELANLIAWRLAGVAVLRSMSTREAEKFLASEERVEMPWPAAQSGGSCGVTWEEQPDPEYPDYAEMRGYAGGALAVFDLDRSGRIRNERILAEVPSNVFGKSILEVLPKWRATVPADMPDACLTDRVLTYEFYFVRGNDQPRKPSTAR